EALTVLAIRRRSSRRPGRPRSWSTSMPAATASFAAASATATRSRWAPNRTARSTLSPPSNTMMHTAVGINSRALPRSDITVTPGSQAGPERVDHLAVSALDGHGADPTDERQRQGRQSVAGLMGHDGA